MVISENGISRFPSVDGSLTISILPNLLHFYQTFSIDKYKYRLRTFQEQISLYNTIFFNLAPYFIEILGALTGLNVGIYVSSPFRNII
jgi:hypothetical protein